MAYSKIQKLPQEVDSGPEKPLRPGGPKPCLLYPLLSELNGPNFDLGLLVAFADCDTWNLKCNISYSTSEPMGPRDF